MAYYRIYRTDGDGHIKGMPTEVECDGDREVIIKAKALLNGLDLEIWELARRVAVLKAHTQ